MRSWGSAAAVIAALEEDAAAEIERIEKEAADAVRALRGDASHGVTNPDAEPRAAAARRAAADAEADEDWQDTQAAIADREAWIVDVIERGRHAIAALADADAAAVWMEELAREAAGELPGDACVVQAPASLAARLDDRWRRALEASLERRIAIEFGRPSAGVIVGTPDGRVSFDNSVEARERRTATWWRSKIAALYDAAVRKPAVEQPSDSAAGREVVAT